MREFRQKPQKTVEDRLEFQRHILAGCDVGFCGQNIPAFHHQMRRFVVKIPRAKFHGELAFFTGQEQKRVFAPETRQHFPSLWSLQNLEPYIHSRNAGCIPHGHPNYRFVTLFEFLQYPRGN